MGKSTSKIIETLYLWGSPKRYIVTNTDKIVLVTYDLRYAERIAKGIKIQENPKDFFVKILK